MKRSNNAVARARDELTREEKLERIKRDAIRDALADERVVDEDTFRASVRAREARAIAAEDEEMRKEYHNISPSRDNKANGSKPLPSTSNNKVNGNSSARPAPDQAQTTKDKDKDYQIATERAEMITRWIREAPPPGLTSSEGGVRKRTGKKGLVRGLRKEASDMSGVSVADSCASSTVTGLEGSIESLDMVD